MKTASDAPRRATPWHNSDGSRRQGTVTPTALRDLADIGHRRPDSGIDRTGAPWRGTSRVIDRPARRKANRLSWRKAVQASVLHAKAARAAALADLEPAATVRAAEEATR